MEEDSNTKVPVGSQACLLESLPPELLPRIFEHILPQNLTFSFSQTESKARGHSDWTLFAARGKHAQIPVVNKPRPRSGHRPWHDYTCSICTPSFRCIYDNVAENMHTALLYVSKIIASEARAHFFRRNLISLNISAKPHHPVSLKSPLIFGPLGLPHRLHLLRDLKRIELNFDVDNLTSYSATRLRARAQHFVDILQEHAGDTKKQSLLKQLYVHLNGIGPKLAPERANVSSVAAMSQVLSRKGCSPQEYYMFALEPLVSLQGIEDIQIRGVTAWFKKCLEKCIRGNGGNPAHVEWPRKMVMRRPGHRKKKIELKVSMGEGWQPLLDWREFAQRNDIELPENIDRFFPPLKRVSYSSTSQHDGIT